MTGTNTNNILLPGDPLPPSVGTGSYLSASGTHASLAAPTTALHNTPRLPTPGTCVLGVITRTTPRFAQLDILASTSPPPPPPPPLSGPGASPPRCPSHLPTTTTKTVPYPFPHPAQIRLQDVRATEQDKLVMSACFRVGDLVRATVLATGDERNYYCGTAGDGFGVVLARGKTGRSMVGVSWREVVEWVPAEEEEGRGGGGGLEGGGSWAGRRETRKVARVV